MRMNDCVGHVIRPTMLAYFSKSADELVKKITVIVIVFEAAGPVGSEKKTETMLLQTRGHASRAPPFLPSTDESTGQRTKHTVQFL